MRFARSLDVDANPEVVGVRRLQPIRQYGAQSCERLRLEGRELEAVVDQKVASDDAKRTRSGGDELGNGRLSAEIFCRGKAFNV